MKILILGSNPETAEIVAEANKLGYTTYVINQIVNSPAKKLANFSFNLDPSDSVEVDKIIKRENIEAVLLGVSDPLLPTYYEICKRHDLPCYANRDSVRIFSSKFEFSLYCQKFNIKPIPNFDPDLILKTTTERSIFPVVVKPIDSGAAVGISLCRNEGEIRKGIEIALRNSRKKKIIIEKYMNCDDLFAYYSVINGKVELAMLADRYKSYKAGDFNSVCLFAEYPSKHLHIFLEHSNAKFIKMIENLEIEKAVLGIQIFYDGNEFFAYDPGFRLQGEGPHFYLNELNGINQVEILLGYAANAPISTANTFQNFDPTLNGKTARTIWVLGRPGIISEIVGLDEISDIPNVIKVLNRFSPGDYISEDMIGTERQVLMRIYTIGDNRNILNEVAMKIANVIQVLDNKGDSLISDIYSPNYNKL